METEPSPKFSSDSGIFPGDISLENIDLESTLLRGRRQPLRYVLVILICGALLSLIVLRPYFPALFQPSARTHASATKIPAFQQPIDVSMNFSSGTLLVNGHTQSLHAFFTRITTHLNMNKNTLTVTVPPFQPRSCIITLPITTLPTTNTSRSPVTSCNVLGFEYPFTIPIVGFYFSLTDLSPMQQQQATTQINLESTMLTNMLHTTVPTGQHYASGYAPNGTPNVAIATQSIPTHLVVLPQLDNSACASLYDGCISSWPSSNALVEKDPLWFLTFNIALVWQYETSLGETLIPFPNTSSSDRANIITFALTYAHSTWSMAAPSILAALLKDSSGANTITDMLCNQGANMLANLPKLQPKGLFSPEVFPANFGNLDACELTVTLNPLDKTSAKYHYLFHFGALLAIDEASHRYIPQLPLATSQELQLLPSTP